MKTAKEAQFEAHSVNQMVGLALRKHVVREECNNKRLPSLVTEILHREVKRFQISRLFQRLQTVFVKTHTGI